MHPAAWRIRGLSAVVVAGSAWAALAGPVERSIIDAEARWVVHLDLEAAMRSEPGKVLLELARDGRVPARDRFVREMGFDPFAEGRGLTVYGRSFDEDGGVAILTASAEADRARASMHAAGLGEHATQAVGSVEVHSWSHDDERLYAAVVPGGRPDERRVLFTGSMDAMRRALRVITTDLPALDAQFPIPEGPGTILAVAADGFGSESDPAPAPGSENATAGAASPSGGPSALVLRGVRTMQARLSEETGEAGREIRGELLFRAVSPERAVQMRRMLDGTIAALEMTGEDSPDMAALAAAAASVQVASSGTSVTVRASHDASQAAALVRLMMLMQGPREPAREAGKEPGNAPTP
ncbi:MAG: hypothetical protein SFY69_12730 [Planctomycetota bacterium]|nr:hypothetical protein [Planctomycetota bacterium]